MLIKLQTARDEYAVFLEVLKRTILRLDCKVRLAGPRKKYVCSSERRVKISEKLELGLRGFGQASSWHNAEMLDLFLHQAAVYRVAIRDSPSGKGRSGPNS
jgi:hypothetical protein